MVTGRGDRDPRPPSRRIASACQPGGFRGTRHSAGRQCPGNTGIKGWMKPRAAAGPYPPPPGLRGALPPRPLRARRGRRCLSRGRAGTQRLSPRPTPAPALPQDLPPSSQSAPEAAERAGAPRPFPSLPAPPGVCGNGPDTAKRQGPVAAPTAEIERERPRPSSFPAVPVPRRPERGGQSAGSGGARAARPQPAPPSPPRQPSMLGGGLRSGRAGSAPRRKGAECRGARRARGPAHRPLSRLWREGPPRDGPGKAGRG